MGSDYIVQDADEDGEDKVKIKVLDYGYGNKLAEIEIGKEEFDEKSYKGFDIEVEGARSR